jgi:GNAT superfamily N-acetyltransferase
MRIRRAAPSDQSSLVELQRTASLTAYQHIFPPDQFAFPLAATEEHWQRVLASDGVEVLIAEVSGTTVGVIAVQDSEVHSLFVDPPRWRNGIGSRLLTAAVRRIASRGERTAHLWVMRDNEPARRFYQHHGWRPSIRTKRSSYPPHPQILEYVIDL